VSVDIAPTTRPRPARAARQFGYLVGALVNLVLLWLVNVRPGWEVVPFLTPEMAQVLPLVNASMAAGLVAQLVYVVADPRWLRASGDLVVTTVGLVAIMALWRTFPFTFAGTSFDWALVVRILLGLGVVGSVIGVVVALVTLVSRRWSTP
jgi:hypothetical protein